MWQNTDPNQTLFPTILSFPVANFLPIILQHMMGHVCVHLWPGRHMNLSPISLLQYAFWLPETSLTNCLRYAQKRLFEEAFDSPHRDSNGSTNSLLKEQIHFSSVPYVIPSLHAKTCPELSMHVKGKDISFGRRNKNIFKNSRQWNLKKILLSTLFCAFRKAEFLHGHYSFVTELRFYKDTHPRCLG